MTGGAPLLALFEKGLAEKPTPFASVLRRMPPGIALFETWDSTVSGHSTGDAQIMVFVKITVYIVLYCACLAT